MWTRWVSVGSSRSHWRLGVSLGSGRPCFRLAATSFRYSPFDPSIWIPFFNRKRFLLLLFRVAFNCFPFHFSPFLLDLLYDHWLSWIPSSIGLISPFDRPGFPLTRLLTASIFSSFKQTLLMVTSFPVSLGCLFYSGLILLESFHSLLIRGFNFSFSPFDILLQFLLTPSISRFSWPYMGSPGHPLRSWNMKMLSAMYYCRMLTLLLLSFRLRENAVNVVWKVGLKDWESLLTVLVPLILLRLGFFSPFLRDDVVCLFTFGFFCLH